MPSVQKTTNLGLNKWQGNEYAKRTDFVDDNEKIDKAVGNLANLKTAKKDSLVNAVNEVKEGLSTLKLESTAIDVVDTANNFTADNSGKKLLEDVLVQINTKIQANSTELGTNKTTLLNNITGIREVL